MIEQVSSLRHYIRLRMLSVKTPQGTQLRLNLFMKFFFIIRFKWQQSNSDQYWMVESVPLTTAQKTVMGQQSNSLKNRMKKVKSDVPLFQYKVIPFFFFLFLTQFQKVVNTSQDSLLSKLLGQFIELRNTQFFKRLKNLT